MNILYLSGSSFGHDINWIASFSAQHQVFILLRKAFASQFDAQQRAAIEQTQRVKFVGEVDDFSVTRFWQTWATQQYIHRIIQQYNIDILHIMYAEPHALWGNFRQRWGVPMLLTTRGTDVLKTIPLFFHTSTLLARLVRWAYRRAFAQIDCITSTSTRQIQAIERYLQRSREVHLIRTGVDIQHITSDTSAHLPTAVVGKRYVLFPRNMRPLYNHEFAIEAINRLPADVRQSVAYVFVNKNSADVAYVAKIETALQQAQIDYIFLDTQAPSALFELYKRAACVVMTPLSDGAPVSAMEAMACGTPLVLSPLEYDQDLFGEGVCTLRAWDSQELADTLAGILRQTILLDTARARQIIIERADRQAEMQKLAALYASLYEK